MPAGARRAVAAALGRLPEGGDVSSARNRVRRLAGSLALDAPSRYARYMAWFDPAQRRALYTPEFAAGGGS